MRNFLNLRKDYITLLHPEDAAGDSLQSFVLCAMLYALTSKKAVTLYSQLRLSSNFKNYEYFTKESKKRLWRKLHVVNIYKIGIYETAIKNKTKEMQAR